MQVKIVDVGESNFDLIPRPSNKNFNCQECFYWVGKKDGKEDLVKKKKNWLKRQAKKSGSLAKVLLWGKREKPIGYAQFGPILDNQTAQLIYRKTETNFPQKGWCLTCVAIHSRYRRKGLAARLLRNVLRDLKRRGIKVVDAYPIKGTQAWNQISSGPLGLYQKLSFEVIKEFTPQHNKWSQILVRKKL